MKNKELTPEEYFALPRHEQSLDFLTNAINGARKSGGSLIDHSMSIRLDIFNYPRIKTLSDSSGSSMNQIINDMLEVAYATMLSSMNETDSAFLKQQVQATAHNWIQEQERKNNAKT